jgi:ribosome-associated toxin RatA of RatAB toxin-antitoxin module
MMLSLSRPGLLMKCLALSLAVATPALAEPNAEQKRLMKKRDAERYQIDASGTSIRGGAARVTVKAPMKVVQKTVTDFKNYGDFISKFEKVRVVGREGDKTDVYLQVPILKRAAKIWAVLRFEAPKTVDGWEVVDAHMVKGNIKRLDARWRIKKIDDENTQLNLEMVIIPKMPVPGSLVTDEASYASDVAVMGARDRSEKVHSSKEK